MDAEHAVDTVHFEYRVPARPPSLSALRHGYGAWLRATPVREGLGPDLVLAASELCTAARRVVALDAHAPEVLMRSWLDDAALVIEVTEAASDPGVGIDGLSGADASRGLSVVATLTDVLTVRASDGGTLMRARKEHAAEEPGGFAASEPG